MFDFFPTEYLYEYIVSYFFLLGKHSISEVIANNEVYSILVKLSTYLSENHLISLDPYAVVFAPIEGSPGVQNFSLLQ